MSSYVSADDVAAKLEHAKRAGQGWVASCPAHDDNQPSLRVSPGKKATVLYCHAGCNYQDILTVLGYRKEQMFYDYEASESRSHLNRSRLNEKFRQMIADHAPWTPHHPIARVDDVMWEALVTDKLPIETWSAAICRAWLEYPDLMSMSYPEAMTYAVIFQDGPLFTFLQPLWQHLKRPNWSKLKTQAMSKMGEVYRDTVTDADWGAPADLLELIDG